MLFAQRGKCNNRYFIAGKYKCTKKYTVDYKRNKVIQYNNLFIYEFLCKK